MLPDVGEHLDGGRLARAVRSEEAEELTWLDREIDVIDRGEVAKGSGERGSSDRRRHD